MSLNDLLAGGAKTIKLGSIGETITGIIQAVTTRQATDFKTKQPEFWDDGNPKMQIVLTIESDHLEDGEGSFYAKTWGADRQALQEAIAATGLNADQALAPGNQITITHTEERPNKTPGLNATKVYAFQITPKAPSTVNAALATPPQQAPAAPPTAPVAAPVAVPAPPAVPAVQAAPVATTPAAAQAQAPGVNIPALISAGLTDQQIADATGTEASVVAIIRANQPQQVGGNVDASAPF